MAHPRPLLIPWLREKVDSGTYPGVQWTNQEKTEFSIPWKHALRQDSSGSDILIFKAWAEASGNGRVQGDSSVWKRNFRSALRAKGFKLVTDNKNDAANPHKVFHWPAEAKSGANSSAGAQEQEDAIFFNDFNAPHNHVPDLDEALFLTPENMTAADYPENHDILQECLKDLNISPQSEGTTGFEPLSEQQQLQDQFVIGGHPLPGQQQDPVIFEGAFCETGLPEQPARVVVGAVGGDGDDWQYAAQFLNTVNKTRDGDSFKTHFRITVYYRGVEVAKQQVDTEAGFRLVYRPDLVSAAVDPKTGLSLVSLPQPKGILDQTQARLTQRILDMLGDGLEVRVSANVVWGQRHGETKVFWSFCRSDNSRKPQEISKRNPDQLYLFRDFIQEIIYFSNGRGSPPCSLFFCLGEKWPDPDNRPWDKKLITVEVVLISMELLKTIAVEGGASSLKSVDLQISLEEMMDLC
ncbi:interferon regulatory factor 3 isoform X1 [Nothobranchius furzeri]